MKKATLMTVSLVPPVWFSFQWKPTVFVHLVYYYFIFDFSFYSILSDVVFLNVELMHFFAREGIWIAFVFKISHTNKWILEYIFFWDMCSNVNVRRERGFGVDTIKHASQTANFLLCTFCNLAYSSPNQKYHKKSLTVNTPPVLSNNIWLRWQSITVAFHHGLHTVKTLFWLQMAKKMWLIVHSKII